MIELRRPCSLPKSCFRGIHSTCSSSSLFRGNALIPLWLHRLSFWLCQAAGVSHWQYLHYPKAAGRKTVLVPATTMKLWMVSKHLEYPWSYQGKAANENVFFQRKLNPHQESGQDERLSKSIVSSNLVRWVQDPMEVGMGVGRITLACEKKFTNK